MAINTAKVVTGGVVSGIVGNIVGYVGFGMLLGPRMEAELVAAAPTLAGRSMTGSAIATQVVMAFLTGLVLVWLYAAIRPRFGPGPKTAIYAALVVWTCGFIFHIDWLIAGLMSTTSYALASAMALVQVIASAIAGAWVYSET